MAMAMSETLTLHLQAVGKGAERSLHRSGPYSDLARPRGYHDSGIKV